MVNWPASFIGHLLPGEQFGSCTCFTSFVAAILRPQSILLLHVIASHCLQICIMEVIENFQFLGWSRHRGGENFSSKEFWKSLDTYMVGEPSRRQACQQASFQEPHNRARGSFDQGSSSPDQISENYIFRISWGGSWNSITTVYFSTEQAWGFSYIVITYCRNEWVLWWLYISRINSLFYRSMWHL